MYVVAPIASRNGFGRLLRSRGLFGHAVEVGTHRGEFAAHLLSSWPGRLTCVDHYAAGYDPADPAALGDRAADEAEARALLAPFGARADFLKEPSPAAAARFADGSLDLVYVDGDHRYEAVLADLLAFWPKVRPGGFLAGHDVICPGEHAGGHGPRVQAALDEFLRQTWPHRYIDIIVHLMAEPDGSPWSFYVERPRQA